MAPPSAQTRIIANATPATSKAMTATVRARRVTLSFIGNDPLFKKGRTPFQSSTLRFLPVFPDPDVDGQRNFQRSRRLHPVAHDRGESVGPVLRHFEQQLVV